MLEQLIPKLSAEEFATSYWLQKPLAAHATLERFPQTLRSGPMASLEALLAVYRGRVNFSRGSKSHSSLPAANVAPMEIYNMGLTLYLGDVADYLPDAAALLHAFERDLGLPRGCARLGVFASPPGEGAPCHYDSEDVFSIQLAGSKTFEVAPMREIKNPVGRQYSPGREPYTDLYPQVKEDFPDPDRAHFKKVRMEPGSVLYLPRGTWHRSTAHTDSFAVSIIANPQVLLDAALAQLRKLLLQSPAWRAPLTAVGLTELEQTLATLPEAASQLDFNSLEQPLMWREDSTQGFSGSTRFIRNPHARARVSKDAENELEMQRRFRGGRFTTVGVLKLKNNVMQLAKHINKRKGPFTAADLRSEFGKLREEQIARLVELLAQAGIISALDYPVLQSTKNIVRTKPVSDGPKG